MGKKKTYWWLCRVPKESSAWRGSRWSPAPSVGPGGGEEGCWSHSWRPLATAAHSGEGLSSLSGCSNQRGSAGNSGLENKWLLSPNHNTPNDLPASRRLCIAAEGCKEERVWPGLWRFQRLFLCNYRRYFPWLGQARMLHLHSGGGGESSTSWVSSRRLPVWSAMIHLKENTREDINKLLFLHESLQVHTSLSSTFPGFVGEFVPHHMYGY